MAGLDKFHEFYEIGIEIEIDANHLRDRVSEDLNKKLLMETTGTIVDYKITDGTEIGFFVKLKDETTHWFFKEEIYPLGGQRQKLRAFNKSSKGYQANNYKIDFALSKQISYVLNPINFAKWFLSSSKDIF